MTETPLASIVVPCKGHAEQLTRCLRSLDVQVTDFAYDIVVVDSASDPAVLAACRDLPRVRVVRSQDDLRAGPARNLGVRESRGELVAFIDADCQADPTWLAEAASELGRGAQLVGGPILDAMPWHPVAITDNLLQFSDFPAGRHGGPARYFPGCNMAVRRDTFLAVSGFPAVRMTAGEDTAFCDRILDRWPTGLRFVRGMRVRHDGRTGVGEFLRHQSSFGYARGALGLHMTEAHRRWGARSVTLPAVVLKRLSYLVGRRVRWDLAGTPRTVVLLPLIIGGLCAWAGGFRRGCRDALREVTAGRATAAGGPSRA